MVAACVAALTGDRYQDATLTLRAVAERATSRHPIPWCQLMSSPNSRSAHSGQ